jgi:hypothetical protein
MTAGVPGRDAIHREEDRDQLISERMTGSFLRGENRNGNSVNLTVA